ncbi:MAG: ABC transporter substrate-binding protein [Pseudomonadota bacterium]
MLILNKILRNMKSSTLSLCLLMAISLGLCFLAPTQSMAADSPAQTQLSTTIDSVLDILKHPEYADPSLRPALRAEIEEQIRKIFDDMGFAMRTVGPKWRDFSDAQRKTFADAFSGLLRATYLNSLDGYSGETIEYTGERYNKKQDKVEIQTVLRLKDKVPVPIFYRMSDENGQWLVYDVVVEGISLVKNYRSQFAELLQSGSPEELIAQINQKTEDLQKKAAEAQ